MLPRGLTLYAFPLCSLNDVMQMVDVQLCDSSC